MHLEQHTNRKVPLQHTPTSAHSGETRPCSAKIRSCRQSSRQTQILLDENVTGRRKVTRMEDGATIIRKRRNSTYRRCTDGGSQISWARSWSTEERRPASAPLSWTGIADRGWAPCWAGVGTPETLQAKGSDSREGGAGNACSCAGRLQSCRTSPRRRAGWPVLCTAGCRERERESLVGCLAFPSALGQFTMWFQHSANNNSPNTHFLLFHTTWQNNEKRLQSHKTRSLSLFLCTGKKWNYVWAKKNQWIVLLLHVFKEKLLLAVKSGLWKI